MRDNLFKKGLVVGISVCTMLITIAVLPASANIIPKEDGNKENLSPYAIIFINAKIDNLTEEIIDGEVHIYSMQILLECSGFNICLQFFSILKEYMRKI